MKATLLLCDHVAVAEGKLYVAGGGWGFIGPAPSPTGIALLISVPWDQTNRPHKFRIHLEREDGEPVVQTDPLGQQRPVEFAAEFEVGRPVGVTPGTPIEMPVALNIPPLALEPGARFCWILEVNGDRHDEWRLPFSVRSAHSAQVQNHGA